MPDQQAARFSVVVTTTARQTRWAIHQGDADWVNPIPAEVSIFGNSKTIVSEAQIRQAIKDQLQAMLEAVDRDFLFYPVTASVDEDTNG
jgi:hypothetical protein